MSLTTRLPFLTNSRVVAIGGALFTLANVASAQDDAWHLRLTPYAWATDVGIDAALDGRQVVDATIPVEDLLEDIDLTFQGRIEWSRGEHGLLVDLFYVSMTDTVSGVQLPQGAGSGDIDWRLDMTIADVAGTFDPEGDGRGISFMYGVRIIDERSDVDATFTTTSGTSAQEYGADSTLVDALFGVRASFAITQNLAFQSQIDASTGGTDLTWSAFPALTYTFGEGRYALLAGYRHMTVDFEDEGGLDTEMSLSGPVLGFRVAL